MGTYVSGLGIWGLRFSGFRVPYEFYLLFFGLKSIMKRRLKESLRGRGK